VVTSTKLYQPAQLHVYRMPAMHKPTNLYNHRKLACCENICRVHNTTLTTEPDELTWDTSELG
jgi:hypothetical protein